MTTTVTGAEGMCAQIIFAAVAGNHRSVQRVCYSCFQAGWVAPHVPSLLLRSASRAPVIALPGLAPICGWRPICLAASSADFRSCLLPHPVLNGERAGVRGGPPHRRGLPSPPPSQPEVGSIRLRPIIMIAPRARRGNDRVCGTVVRQYHRNALIH